MEVPNLQKSENNSPNFLKFNYQVPITVTESETITDGEFSIEGTAINVTTTSNNHKFLAEELRTSAQSLIGVPLLTDHENKVENIKGRVKWAEFDEMTQRIPFKAMVKDAKIREMIKDGLINSVSVGAAVRDVEEEDGVFIPRGIEFKELSLVAVPADMGATFQVAMKEAYETQKSHSQKDNYTIERRLDTMEEENSENVKQPEAEVKAEPEAKEEPEKAEEPKAEEKEEAKAEEKLSLKLLEEVKSLKEEIKALKVKEEVESDDSEEEDEDEVEEAYKILQGNRSFSVVRNKY